MAEKLSAGRGGSGDCGRHSGKLLRRRRRRCPVPVSRCHPLSAAGPAAIPSKPPVPLLSALQGAAAGGSAAPARFPLRTAVQLASGQELGFRVSEISSLRFWRFYVVVFLVLVVFERF